MWYDPLFSGSAAIFGVPAVLGTAFFTLRTILGFAGLTSHGADALGSHDLHHDGVGFSADDADIPHPHPPHHSQTPDTHAPQAATAKAGAVHGVGGTAWFTVAEIFSVQSLAAFAGAFGWAGLIGRESLGVLAGLAAGAVAGTATSAGVLTLFRQIRRLESHGNLAREDLLGLEATVYVGVPERGRGMGQVRVAARGMDRIVNATSRDVAIATGGRVLVVATGPDHSVVVQAMTRAGQLAAAPDQRAAPALPEKGEV